MRMDTAEWRPLPENATQPGIEPTMVIVHTAVDGAGPTDLAKWFGRADIRVESHFWLPRGGGIVQMMDTNVRADANYRINDRAISIETEDDGDPEGNPWTAAQVDDLVEVLTWCTRDDVHRIPRQLCAGPYSPGIGWHSMQGYPDPIGLRGVAQPSPWTTALGKTCPGRRRIRQLLDDVLPRLGMDTRGITRIDQSTGVPTMPDNPLPDPKIVAAQELLLELGATLPRFGADGFWGDETAFALESVAERFRTAVLERGQAVDLAQQAVNQRDQALADVAELESKLDTALADVQLGRNFRALINSIER